MNPKFGDVLKDKNDNEIIMVVTPQEDNDGDCRVVLLVPYDASSLGAGEVTWRALDTGLWEPADG